MYFFFKCWHNSFFVALHINALLLIASSSEKAAFPAPVVRDLGKDWIRAPTETNNGSYERRGEGRPNANIHFVRLGEPALNTDNYQLPPNVSKYCRRWL